MSRRHLNMFVDVGSCVILSLAWCVCSSEGSVPSWAAGLKSFLVSIEDSEDINYSFPLTARFWLLWQPNVHIQVALLVKQDIILTKWGAAVVRCIEAAQQCAHPLGWFVGDGLASCVPVGWFWCFWWNLWRKKHVMLTCFSKTHSLLKVPQQTLILITVFFSFFPSVYHRN